jgi:threonine dehydratase
VSFPLIPCKRDLLRWQKLNAGCKRLVASSGGNAGMAAAYVARHLKVPLTLYVPQSTGSGVIEKLSSEVIMGIFIISLRKIYY